MLKLYKYFIIPKVCRYFVNGTCKYGNKCRFSHNIPKINLTKDFFNLIKYICYITIASKCYQVCKLSLLRFCTYCMHNHLTKISLFLIKMVDLLKVFEHPYVEMINILFKFFIFSKFLFICWKIFRLFFNYN
jgi:hypothetical protein